MFTADIIRAKKQSVGALRSMGTKSVDVFGIFFFACLLLMMLALLCGSILSILTNLIINAQLMSTYNIGVSLFGFSGAAFGIMLATSVIVVVFGSMIPIAYYCNKTPVDVLKR